MLGFAVALRALGADVRMCAPPDFAEQVARIDVPMVAAGQSVLIPTCNAWRARWSTARNRRRLRTRPGWRPSW